MKQLVYTILVILMSACSNDFLEKYPVTSLNEGNFYNDQNDFIGLVNGCYIPLRDYTKVNFWVMTELSSDNASHQERPDGGQWPRTDIDEWLTSANNTVVSQFWTQSYDGINRCNTVLDRIETRPITWENNKIRERCMGEARFLRALYYFNLVRLFGDVPLVLRPINYEEATNIKREKESLIFDQVVDDLGQAAAHLNLSASESQKGRATEGAALALLGKVYLTAGKHTEAAAQLRKVIDGNSYRLLSDYSALFDNQNKNHQESIFAVQYSEANANVSQRFIFDFAPQTSMGEVTKRPAINIIGSGWNIPTSDLINSFHQKDIRKEVSIGWWKGKGKDGIVSDFPYCAKYKPPVSAPDARCGDNFMILRYADVLLMYAEALNELDQPGNAATYLQMVRKRAGLTEDLPTTGKEELRKQIWKERQLELCFENHRWFDLKRTGQILEVMQKHAEKEKKERPYLSLNAYQITNDKLVFPIPTQEVVTNKLEQNPGY